MSTGKVVLGVLAGLAAGAILGILFAPDKGSVTRMKITQKGEDYADAVKNRFSSFIDSINEKFESVKDDISRGKQKVQEVKKDVKSAATSM
jgi:gas vesicle protein